MRKRLLLFCFTLSLVAYAFALDDGNYLVRNVASGKYWGVANAWGTRASLVSNPEYVTWKRLENGKYHLESQVNNGETAYYFNGDYMDNDSPIELTIEQQPNGYYTISNGEIYYGYDGNSTVLGKTETTPTANNVQWEIKTVIEATSALSNATQESPMNATFVLADPNFGRNNRYYDQWTFEASNKDNNGEVSNYCVESWHSTFAMSQTINVPNGVYGLTAQGFYRQDGSDNAHLPVFYMNDATRVFPIINGTENSMSDASASFTSGLYTTEPIFVRVTDGTLSLGARLEGNTTLWCIWDNFTLMYYGTEANVEQMNFDVRFGSIVAEISELQNTEGVTTEGQSKISSALAAYNGIDAYSSESDQQTVEDQLKSAISYVKQGQVLIDQLSKVYTRYRDKLDEMSGSDSDLKSLLTNIGAAISTNTYLSNEKIEEWISSFTAARQQYYPYEYRYWFDNDESTESTGLSAIPNWSFDADLSNLEESFHSLHIQVVDKDNIPSSPITKFFVKSIDTGATQSRYWFDDDVDNIKTSPQIQGVFDIDVSQLEEGFHVIRYQLVGTNGDVSQTASRSFYKVFIPSMSTWRCWFDNDYTTVQTGTDMSKTLLLDVTQLRDGYHALHIQVDGGAQAASTPITKPFVKIPQTEGVDYLTCLCMIDDQLYKQEQVSSKGGIMNWNFDVSSLPQGFHRIFIQVVTPSGAATSTYQSFFVRETTREEFSQMKCVYAIDGAEFYTEAGTLANGTFHFDLDVASIEDGLHRLTYMLSNGLGVSTKVQTQFFVKTPLGGNGICEYWYWLNDQADYNATKVSLPNRQDPFSLITLLPIESQPIRSSLFQFRIEDDAPVIYAKNDIHIRFYDAAGRFTDATKQFVDESVGQEVSDITLLNAGERRTSAKPDDNTIKWYKVEAEKGDSLSFKTDYPCSIQLFSPSGEELYSVFGPDAIRYGGSYAPEDGTYYLALHDVTAQYCQNLSIDYQHIDKYAVLSYTPDKIGVAPSSFTMQLEGNGFDKLQSVALENGGFEIIPDILNVSGKSEVSLHFVLSGDEDYGDYNLKLIFTDDDVNENLIVPNAVTFEEAVYGNIETSVSSKLILASPYPVTIKVKNTGNVSQTMIPFFIAYDNSDHISDMQFNNFNVIVEKKLTDAGFKLDNTTDNLLDKGVRGRYYSLMIPELGPNEEAEFELGFIAGSHTRFNLYAWTSKAWSLYTNKMAKKASFKMLLRAPQSTECMPDPCELLGALVDDASCPCNMVMANIEALANLYAALQMHTNMESIRRAGYNSYWEAKEALGIEMDMFERKRLRNPNDILWRLAENCGSENLTRFMSMWHAMQQQDSEDPCPDPNPNPIEILNPGDPNDIFGYMSESGSKYMREGITDVYYTIEFENDPKIATASAHTIIVKDTLDTSRFDLSTFAATGIKLGDVKMELNGEKNFSRRTMDLRPAIDVIAQVSLAFDEKKGIATWTIESLDPMSMEPTEDAMQGVLPVNVNGNGQGELTFDIQLKPGMVEGESVSNRAGIIFDQEGVIMTPYWTNTVDATTPSSSISACEIKNDTVTTLHFDSSDNLSGIWKYDVYVQYGQDAMWERYREGVTDAECDIRIFEGINHGFYVVATDSAGNMESKEAAREYTLDIFDSTEDSDLELALVTGWNWISHNLNTNVNVDDVKANALRILGQEEETDKDETFGFVGDLTELKPVTGYKMQMLANDAIPLSGKLFNTSYKSISLSEGWNWIGYPFANEMEISQALANFTPDEEDYIIGQDGFAEYVDGEWIGTLSTLAPGLGYIYKSGSSKQMFFNSTATLSSRMEIKRLLLKNGDPWTCDKYKYPNVMPMTARIYNGDFEEKADDYYVAAFCGNECRGVGKTVKDCIMMNVYGQGNETITFKVINKQTDQLVDVAQSVKFADDILGTYSHPFQLTLGEDATDIAEVGDGSITITPSIVKDHLTVSSGNQRVDRLTIYGTNGAVIATWKKLHNGHTVDVSSIPAGAYLVKVKAGKDILTKKIMKLSE